jgi:hypothetical protein
MPYAIMTKNMCQNIKYNTRYDSLSIALTYMSVATLYVGHLRMFYYIISNYGIKVCSWSLILPYCCVLRSGGSWSSHTPEGTSPCFRNSGSVHPSRSPLPPPINAAPLANGPRVGRTTGTARSAPSLVAPGGRPTSVVIYHHVKKGTLGNRGQQ